MDSGLLKAAQLGDVASLRALLDEDPLILEQSALTPTAGTPLHVAALSGKADFVHEIMLRKPSFAWELNQDGFSPLHIAVAVGNKDVVVELLKLGPNLCLLKDKQGLIPLHYAAIKGRVAVIEELVRCCPESLKEPTTRGQTTVLHLAVKNSQFEAFKTLIEELDDDEVKDLVNAEDEDGNTIHQLAVASKQLQVLLYLERHAKVGINSIEIVYGDKRLEEDTEAMPKATITQKEVITAESPQPKQPDQSEKTDADSLVLRPLLSENMLLVVASVIATVTFQGISPPETLFKGDTDLAKNCTHSTIFSDEKSCSKDLSYFILSMAFNSTGFFAATCLLMLGRSITSSAIILVPVAAGCMMLTYIFNFWAIYPESMRGFPLVSAAVLTILVEGAIFFDIFKFIRNKVGGGIKKRVNKVGGGIKNRVMSMRRPPLIRDTSNVEGA